MTLTEFLEARISEREDLLLTSPPFITEDSAHGVGWGYRSCPVCGLAGFSGHESVTDDAWYEHAEQEHERTFVLAECASKRRIVEDHAATAIAHSGQGHDKEPACRQCTDSVDSSRVTVEWDVAERVVAPCDTLRFLALPYADHPDFDEAWRP